MNFIYIIFAFSFVFSQSENNKAVDKNDANDTGDDYRKQFRKKKTDYCEINKDHILCGADGDAVLSEEVKVFYPKTDNDRKVLTHLINKIRDRVADGQDKRVTFTFPPAASMYEVEWNKQFESAAFNGIKNCKDEETFRNCCNCMNTGETEIFAMRQRVEVLTENAFNFSEEFNVVLMRLLEIAEPYSLECIQNSTEECMDRDQFYIHLLHDRIVRIGCIYIRCKAQEITLENGTKKYFAWGHFNCLANLNYYLDVLHQPLYKPGTACTQCPKGSSCSTKYKHLCKCQNISECLIPPPALKKECTTRDGGGDKPDAPPPEQPTPSVGGVPVPVEIEPATRPPVTTVATTTAKASDSGGSQDTSGALTFVLPEKFISFTLLAIVVI